MGHALDECPIVLALKGSLGRDPTPRDIHEKFKSLGKVGQFHQGEVMTLKELNKRYGTAASALKSVAADKSDGQADANRSMLSAFAGADRNGNGAGLANRGGPALYNVLGQRQASQGGGSMMGGGGPWAGGGSAAAQPCLDLDQLADDVLELQDLVDNHTEIRDWAQLRWDEEELEQAGHERTKVGLAAEAAFWQFLGRNAVRLSEEVESGREREERENQQSWERNHPSLFPSESPVAVGGLSRSGDTRSGARGAASASASSLCCQRNKRSRVPRHTKFILWRYIKFISEKIFCVSTNEM